LAIIDSGYNQMGLVNNIHDNQTVEEQFRNGIFLLLIFSWESRNMLYFLVNTLIYIIPYSK